MLGGGRSGKTLTFQSFAGQYFGPPYIPLAPGIDLTGIDGKFALFPPVTELDAGATVTVGAPIACPPYRIDGDAVRSSTPSPVAFDFTGKASLFCIPVAEEYLHVDDTGYVAFGGKVKLDVSVVSLEGQVDAQFLFPHFQAEGTEKICIVGYICGGGAGSSPTGMAACLRDHHQLRGRQLDLRGRGGFDWPPPATLVNPALTAGAILSSARVFTGCDFGHWRTVAARPRRPGAVDLDARRATGVLARGDGAGGAPDVELRGPKGEVFMLPASGPLENNRQATGFRSPVDDTAYFIVAKPAAGAWRIVPRTGSSEITAVRQADGLAEPSISTAPVAAAAAGGQQVFRYRIKPIAGQRVTFVERAPGGDRVLGVANGDQRDASVHAVRRPRLQALDRGARRAGRQRRADNIVVARFTASPPRREAVACAPRGPGSSLVVTWGGPRAEGYQARIKLSDGRSLFFATTRARRFTVRGVPAGRPRCASSVCAGARAAGPRPPSWSPPGDGEAAPRDDDVQILAARQSFPAHRLDLRPYARFDRRGEATSGSVSTLTNAGRPDANERSNAGRTSSGLDTSSAWHPSASTTWS